VEKIERANDVVEQSVGTMIRVDHANSPRCSLARWTTASPECPIASSRRNRRKISGPELMAASVRLRKARRRSSGRDRDRRIDPISSYPGPFGNPCRSRLRHGRARPSATKGPPRYPVHPADQSFMGSTK
jgi:hypothetical protein